MTGAPFLTLLEERVLAIVSRAAERGEAMPSNVEIAAESGSSTSMPSHHVKKLERLGYLRIDRRSTSRRVTVVATGASTAETPYGTLARKSETVSGSGSLLMNWLTELAEAGQPAPTNYDIADRLGLGSPQSATRMMQRLEDRGLIVVERSRTSRQITIVATGHSTARTVRPTANNVTREEGIDDRSLPPRVDRDPCFHCGIRRDIGCRHHPLVRD